MSFRRMILCWLGFHKWLPVNDHKDLSGCLYCGKLKERDDGFDKARVNVAKECMKRGKAISGTMHEDGSFKIDKEFGAKD